MLSSLMLLAGGAAIYTFLKSGNTDDDNLTYGESDTLDYTNEDYQKLTYDYFNNLTIDEQEEYFNDNLDLRFYKDDFALGFTHDRYLNAKHAERIAGIMGKKFDNKNKTY